MPASRIAPRAASRTTMGQGSRGGGAGGDADPSLGCAPGDGGRAFLGVLAQGMASGQWNVERLNSKAKGVLGTGATVLSVLTVGLVGFGRLLDGNVANLAELAPLPGWALWLLPVLGAAGLGSILASMYLATRSLAAFDINNPLDPSDFTADGRAGAPDRDELARCSRMTEDIVLGLYASYIGRIGSLNENSIWAGKLVRASQWCLYGGLASIGAIPIMLLCSLARVPPPA